MEYFLQQLVNGLALGTTYALIALGFVLVFGVMKVFNAALGALVVVSMYAAWWTSEHVTSSLVVCLAAAMVVTVVIGAAVERVAIAPVARRSELAPFLTTLGVSIMLEGLLRTFFTAQPQAIALDYPSSVFDVLGITFGIRQVTVIVVALALIVVTDVVITRTRVGRRLRAVAENPGMASSLGINARRVRFLAVTTASALAVVTGVLLALSYGTVTPTQGLGLMLKGFVILTVGGMTSFRGAAAVGILLGVVEVFTTAYAPGLPRDAITYGLLIVALVARPYGLFSRGPAQARIATG
jgi:branched-chain amino acid transport system permease protein